MKTGESSRLDLFKRAATAAAAATFVSSNSLKWKRVLCRGRVRGRYLLPRSLQLKIYNRRTSDRLSWNGKGAIERERHCCRDNREGV